MLDALVQDVRYALRWLLRSPGFATVAILSLGVGIGCNTAIFAVVDALLLRPLPVREPSRLVDLYTSGADGDTYSTNSLPDILDYREQKDVFADVAGYSPMFAAVSRGDRARLVLGEVVTGNYFATLGVAARLGRTLLPEDDAPARRVRSSCRTGTGSASSAASRRRSEARSASAGRSSRSSACSTTRSPAWCRCSRRKSGCPCALPKKSSPPGSTRSCRRRRARRASIGGASAGCSSRHGSRDRASVEQARANVERRRCPVARRASTDEQGPSRHRAAERPTPGSIRKRTACSRGSSPGTMLAVGLVL